MDVSVFLAQVMGLYLVILCLSFLINADNFTSIISGIFHNAALQFVIGMILVISGILLVVSHNVWESSWVVVITILSWIVLIKGICYMAFPKFIHAMSKPFLNCKKTMYSMIVIDLILGLWLCYMGFFA